MDIFTVSGNIWRHRVGRIEYSVFCWTKLFQNPLSTHWGREHIGVYFAGDIFKWILFDETYHILIHYFTDTNFTDNNHVANVIGPRLTCQAWSQLFPKQCRYSYLLTYQLIINLPNIQNLVHYLFSSWWRLKWKHFPRYWPFVWGIHRSPVNSPHKGQWRGSLMFSLICVWINRWVNNREAGD